MHDPMGTPMPTISADTQIAVAAYLNRYTGATKTLYAWYLRGYLTWCSEQQLDPLVDVRRTHLEDYIRHLEQDRRNEAGTVGGKIATLCGFYRLCEVDGIIEHSPAVHIRRPRVWRTESKTVGLNPVEIMKLLDAAADSPIPTDAALVALMGLMGLRVSEALAVRIEDFAGTDHGHRVLHLIGKGGRPATVPVPPAVLRHLERAAGGRTSGILLMRPDRGRKVARGPMTRAAAAYALERLLKVARIPKHATPHSLRHAYITAGLDLGISLRDMQIAARHSDPRTTSGYDRNRHSLDRHANHQIAANLGGIA